MATKMTGSGTGRGMARVDRRRVAAGRPVAGTLPARPLAGMEVLESATQIRESIKRLEMMSGRVRYRLALEYRKLSRLPEVSAGRGGFGGYLKANDLMSRMTVLKWFTVVDSFSEEEMITLGGMERTYLAVSALRTEKPDADPRSLLKPGARVMGLVVAGASTRAIAAARKSYAMARLGGETKVSPEVKLLGQRMRRALKRVAIPAQARAWLDGKAGVSKLSVRLELAAGERMVQVLKHAEKTGFV